MVLEKLCSCAVPLRLIDGAMPFSRLRQHLPWSYRNDPEKLARLGREFPDEDPEKLEQALQDARGNYIEAARLINASWAQGNASTSPTTNAPRRLQKSTHRQLVNFSSDLVPNHTSLDLYQQPAPPFANVQFGQQPGHAPAQYPSAFAPPPPPLGYFSPQQHYVAVQYVQPGYSPPIPQMMPHGTNAPMPLSPVPAVPQQPMLPWTPSQPALMFGDSRVRNAVPVYELPPPDLMDYDMSYMMAVRRQPEWNKGREDRHWEQVRHERNAAWRPEIGEGRGEDRDECTIM